MKDLNNDDYEETEFVNVEQSEFSRPQKWFTYLSSQIFSIYILNDNNVNVHNTNTVH